MKRIPILAAVLLAGVALPQTGSAETKTSGDLVKQAVAAEGGAKALRGLKRVTITADVKHWEPEQSLVADGEPRFTDDAKMTVTWDLEKGIARTDWDRMMVYPAPSHEVYSEVVRTTLGYVTDAKGDHPMSGVRLATHLRELERASPTLLLKALDAPKSVSALPDQKLGGQTYPAVAFADGATTFTILFDRKTHLPVAVRTLDDDNIHGDSNYDLILADWQPVNGVKVARSLTYKLNALDIGKVAYKIVAANPAIPSQLFAVSDEISKMAKPPATGNVPYQWVLRRLNIYRYIDSDAILYDAAVAGSGLKLVELAPNVQQVVGGSANDLIVAMKDYLVVFDAPVSELQSRWVIDAAKAKYPGKPIKYLVLTHHHMDHTGGARTYVAEGATVIVPAPDKAHFEKDFVSPRTVNPDALQKNPKPATVVEVTDQMTLKDDTDEIRLYNIPNPHVQGMLIGYDVKANLAYVTDLYSPGRDKQKNAGNTAFNEALKKFGITPAVVAGGHGTNGPKTDLDTIVAATN